MNDLMNFKSVSSFETLSTFREITVKSALIYMDFNYVSFKSINALKTAFTRIITTDISFYVLTSFCGTSVDEISVQFNSHLSDI